MFSHLIPLHRTRSGHARRRPRGIAVVLVLGLLAITLAISYATLRGQGTTSQLATNNSRALDARAAAQSGLAAALRKISENSWAGVGAPVAANVTNHSWYHVTFTTGDVRLADTVTALDPSDQRRVEYPFQLTIDSMGYAADPANPAVRAEHHSRCIVQLVRKRLTAEPPNWAAITSDTVYQFSDQNVTVQFPVRIDGTATLMGKLAFFCTEYPVDVSARDQYLSDLNARRLAGQPDYRPFPGMMKIRGFATTQDLATMSLLTGKLGMVLTEPLLSPGEPATHPGAVQTYKLYPGGKEYGVPVLQYNFGSPIQNVSVGPDPVDNPLAVFRSSGSLRLDGNVEITGTIIGEVASDLQLGGSNVRLKALNMPPLYGSSQVHQLPAAIMLDHLDVLSGASAQISGAVMIWDTFELKSGSTSTNFSLTGNLIADELRLNGRISWKLNEGTWNSDYQGFANQLPPPPILYFPDYMQTKRGFAVKPTLTFLPEPSGLIKPHWHDWSQPVYLPDPADPGLRWEVVRWEERL